MFWGRGGTFLPHKVPLHLEIGAPIAVSAKMLQEISDAEIDALHTQFAVAIMALFDRTKVKYAAYEHAQLEIL